MQEDQGDEGRLAGMAVVKVSRFEVGQVGQTLGTDKSSGLNELPNLPNLPNVYVLYRAGARARARVSSSRSWMGRLGGWAGGSPALVKRNRRPEANPSRRCAIVAGFDSRRGEHGSVVFSAAFVRVVAAFGQDRSDTTGGLERFRGLTGRGLTGRANLSIPAEEHGSPCPHLAPSRRHPRSRILGGSSFLAARPAPLTRSAYGGRR